EQDPKVYSRTGVEEFLADGVIVLYNINKDGKRENALEILKLRSSSHKKGLVPYKITSKGITIFPN
ncbi:circadian clock protein KaiC, partial [archaeon]|nr:circadian clock protein KaiC [archaeon]